MRLLLAIENAFYGGGERSFSTLARGLSARGFEVHVLSSENTPFSEEIAPFAAPHRAAGPALFDPGYIIRLVSVIRGVRPDAVHSQGARMDFYCAIACRIAGVEHVSTVAMPVEGFDVGALRKAAYRFFGGIGEGFTSRFITVSAAIKEELVSAHGIAPGRITVIPNCAGGEFFARPGRDESLAGELGLAGCSVIGACGRLVWQKGFPVLLEAFAGLRRSAPEDGRGLKLLIAGSGGLEKELRGRAEALGISDAVIWSGFRKDMPRVLALCDVFVLPSLREGQPIALVEAMAMGLPVAATALPGVMETMSDGAEGLLVPPRDTAGLEGALRKMIEDRELARRLGAAARRRAESDFTEKVFVERHAVFYGAD